MEKPLGRDLETATALDKVLHEHFQEPQIFSIDHVSITAAETLGVEHRAGCCERSGVLRDPCQNHMMQLLSLTAMEPPSLFEADRVRDEKGTIVFKGKRWKPGLSEKEYATKNRSVWRA